MAAAVMLPDSAFTYHRHEQLVQAMAGVDLASNEKIGGSTKRFLSDLSTLIVTSIHIVKFTTFAGLPVTIAPGYLLVQC